MPTALMVSPPRRMVSLILPVMVIMPDSSILARSPA